VEFLDYVPKYRVYKPKFSLEKNIASKQCITSREFRARFELKQCGREDLGSLKSTKKNATPEEKKRLL
jgi:hypothetical protein